MNCKQGDLAIIVKSYAGNEGKIVRCIRFLGNQKIIHIDHTTIDVDCWEIDSKLRGCFGDVQNFAVDKYLRPIKDSDKEDEMLSIARIKEKVKA